jgi:proteic killer suppression protein
MQQIRSAMDERDFYALKSLRFEKLQGKRQHQRSIRINDQWRLILEIVGEAPKKTVWIIGIEDYH